MKLILCTTVRSFKYLTHAEAVTGCGSRRLNTIPRPRHVRDFAPTSVTVVDGHLLDELLGRRLQVVRPSDFGKQVQPHGGHVQQVSADLGRPVVPRENVMVIVPALAHRHDGHDKVLGRLDPPAKRDNG